MNPSSSTARKQDKGAAAPFPCTPNPRSTRAFAPLRTFSIDDAEHFLHNHHASVASLRLLFTFVPERRSAPTELASTFNGIPTCLESTDKDLKEGTERTRDDARIMRKSRSTPALRS